MLLYRVRCDIVADDVDSSKNAASLRAMDSAIAKVEALSESVEPFLIKGVQIIPLVGVANSEGVLCISCVPL
jgi:hypothetical protein